VAITKRNRTVVVMVAAEEDERLKGAQTQTRKVKIRDITKRQVKASS
jgi:antitoxin (DNA-binding transcriptional repressor) of toxin-antitoxin stability system